MRMAPGLPEFPPGGYRWFTSPKRVRARIGGTFVAESDAPRMMIPERGPVRTYLFPRDAVREDLIVGDGRTRDTPFGTVRDVDLEVDGRVVEAVLRYHDKPKDRELVDLVAVHWDRVDAWYEEDEEVFVHPRDPFHRVDVLRSGRHVVIEVDGTVVAESRRPTLLFETGLPTRYYLPQTDVRLEHLEPSDTETACPYKGDASYHHVRVGDKTHKDLVWCYKTPIDGVLGVQGLFCFFNERVDLSVDGTPQERPDTPWRRE